MQVHEEILVEERARGEWRVVINRPAKHNALSRNVLLGLSEAVSAIGANEDSRVIVLAGAGERYFAAGGDLKSLASVKDEAATVKMVEESRSALDAIRDCPVPVVAYLNGNAIGGGAELALSCDMRMQAEWASIGFIQATLAITSAWGGGSDLVQLVGPARAMKMMSHRELVSSEKALDWGLADTVIRQRAVDKDIEVFIEPILQCTPRVLRGIKAQTRAWRQGLPYAERRAVEQQQLLKTWLHQDHWTASDKLLAWRPK
ncbi:enoyl-CoA hydratase/isomerase family protein [Porticoccaceae bacterium]|nr:enoyl-CoA hydratase/isomerase family protein [Porticoccaceae bacterium]